MIVKEKESNATPIVWFSIKVTTLSSNSLMVYSSENILFLHLHFIWLYGSWNHQRILKKHSFWKYDSWFSSERSKLALVRNKLIMSSKYWFMGAKNAFKSCYGPKKWPKYHLKTILTTFSERNKYYEVFFSCLEMYDFRGISPKWILTPLKKTRHHIFKMDVFQNSLVISWAM